MPECCEESINLSGGSPTNSLPPCSAYLWPLASRTLVADLTLPLPSFLGFFLSLLTPLPGDLECLQYLTTSVVLPIYNPRLGYPAGLLISHLGNNRNLRIFLSKSASKFPPPGFSHFCSWKLHLSSFPDFAVWRLPMPSSFTFSLFQPL